MSTETLEIPTEEINFKEEFGKIMGDKNHALLVTALPIVMFNDYVEVEIHNGVKKHLSYNSFKDIINRSLNQVSEAPVISGMLPPSNMIFISQTEQALHINVYHPGANRDMLYGSRKLNVAVPNIVIGFTLKKDTGDWVVQTAHYYCTDLPVSKLPKTFINSVSHAKGIYDLPMSNTYGGGGMCYGGNSMPARFKDGNLRGLDWYFRYLWETPFNNDLGIRAIGGKVGVERWYNILADAAKNNKGFPYKDLEGYRELDGSPPSYSAISR
jgi:hypothetical protein